ncbi:MAG: Coq4 family protein [Pseudomonadota bacterium]
MPQLDRQFAEKFLTSIDDYDAYGVHLLFNDWWESAPSHVIDEYVAAIENHPEQGPLAKEGWIAPPVDMDRLEQCAPGTLGEAYFRFIIDNNLEEQLGSGYRELHEQIKSEGRLERMPEVIQYKVLRGYQTHDMHHILTGYDVSPAGELALQTFGLAQMTYPYAGMWLAVVTAHMTFLEPSLIRLAMDAIADGWAYGNRAKNIQFVQFERQIERPLKEIQVEYGLIGRSEASKPDDGEGVRLFARQ